MARLVRIRDRISDQGGRLCSPSSSLGSTRGSLSACTGPNHSGSLARQMLGSSPSMTLRERFPTHTDACAARPVHLIKARGGTGWPGRAGHDGATATSRRQGPLILPGRAFARHLLMSDRRRHRFGAGAVHQRRDLERGHDTHPPLRTTKQTPGPTGGQARRRFNVSLTSAGLALPCMAFITWPTKKPNSLSLPDLNSATLSWLAAMILSTAASIAPVSMT
jgi:hypothetical protein